ncbi:hypothetical protein [Oceanobacillus jordanicus]|uniref:DUF4362 domain-containing protein n=1 Tax=Oceanobacillus jordanicus TaxID=2867266 RepID=A0AAW5B3T2_9BACI|nr:hypothetical protein [Oceanobacillus jordanicus]MCG3418203.1 hypothetical protein [Oceanobacillus jordanicus]
MYRTKETPKWNGSTVQPKRKVIISLFIILCGVLLMQGCNMEDADKKDIASEKVRDLFQDGDFKKVKEDGSGRIKDSTDQEQINEASEAIEEIDISDEERETIAFVFGLRSAVLVAQNQLNERDVVPKSSKNTDSQDEQIEEDLPDYQPDENDVVLKNSELKNKDILEEFIKVAGENGKNSTSEIRVVKVEGSQGVLIYDLKSMYDKNADQSWIRVRPDVSHYRALENEVQDVFNNAPQQCGYMSKDETEGFYKLFECRTHWEYRLLPTVVGME